MVPPGAPGSRPAPTEERRNAFSMFVAEGGLGVQLRPLSVRQVGARVLALSELS
jgi:hypothetical protein